MTRVKSIPIRQAAKVGGIAGFVLGSVSSCLGLLVTFLFSTASPVETLTALISLPLLGALAGFGGSAVTCWFYNASVEWSGGLWLDLEEETALARSLTEESYVSGPATSLSDSDADERPAIEKPEGTRLSGAGQLEQKDIRVYRMRLGPTETDRTPYGSESHRKPGEWIDVRNDGSANARTSGLCLYHLEYPNPDVEPEYRFVVTLPECSLKPGGILRVHSGPRRELSALHEEDRNGADWHAFTAGEARVWNHLQGDTAVLYALATRDTTDSASYDPNPPEGVVLERQGPKLVPAPAGAGSRLR
jgi:hypothetical protein